MANDELDLHGFTVAEAIERFVQHYNIRVDKNQFGCWRVIHGYGSTGTGENQFSTPWSLAIDSNNCCYIADTGNRRIVKVQL